MNEEKLDNSIYLKDGSHKLPAEHSNIQVTLPNGQTVIYNFTKEVQTDLTNINHEAVHLASIRHFTGHLLAQAQKDVEVSKLALSRYTATKRSEIRNKHPKLTDKDKDDLLNQDETVYKLKRKIIDQEGHVGQIWAIISGLKYKHDMLQTVSSNIRTLKSDHAMSDKALQALDALGKSDPEGALRAASEAFSS